MAKIFQLLLYPYEYFSYIYLFDLYIFLLHFEQGIELYSIIQFCKKAVLSSVLEKIVDVVTFLKAS